MNSGGQCGGNIGLAGLVTVAGSHIITGAGPAAALLAGGAAVVTWRIRPAAG